MEKLTGKTIIFSDLHCGLSGNKVSRLNICVKVIKNIQDYAKRNGVQNIVFGGDWFHSRAMLDNNTVNIAIKLVHALAKTCRLYMIVGNHDAYLKDSIDINSLNIFRQEENVRIIDKAEQIDLNGQTCLLAPWLTDMTTFEKNMFDIMIGHFEVSSKYLIQSYVDDHSAGTKASGSVISEISRELPAVTTDLIGSFVDAVKPTGIIYAGHIHKRRECISRGRKFIFIGAPYQQTMGESGDRCGFYVLDEHNAPTFMEISDVPKYMQLNMSDLITDEFDFAIAPATSSSESTMSKSAGHRKSQFSRNWTPCVRMKKSFQTIW